MNDDFLIVSGCVCIHPVFNIKTKYEYKKNKDIYRIKNAL